MGTMRKVPLPLDCEAGVFPFGSRFGSVALVGTLVALMGAAMVFMARRCVVGQAVNMTPVISFPDTVLIETLDEECEVSALLQRRACSCPAVAILLLIFPPRRSCCCTTYRRPIACLKDSSMSTMSA